MLKLDHDPRAVPDDKLADLVRAVACELIQLGYRPTIKPGEVTGSKEPFRVVAPEVWKAMKAMKEILAGREP